MDYFETEVNFSNIIPYRDICVAELGEIGYESFVETEKGIKAYIQINDFNEDKLKTHLHNVFSELDVEIDFISKIIKDQNWNATWESNYDPIFVNNNCVVAAPFHEFDEKFEYHLLIKPQMSFGTGHHQTTYLMLNELLTMDLTNKCVLDMGCGTGVLAILSKLRKAKRVDAIDIDTWAYENTIDNVALNNLNQIKVQLGGKEKIEHKYDVFIANINKNILKADVDTYINHINENGHLLLSGFFVTDNSEMVELVEALGVRLLDHKSKEDWSMLHFQKA